MAMMRIRLYVWYINLSRLVAMYKKAFQHLDASNLVLPRV